MKKQTIMLTKKQKEICEALGETEEQYEAKIKFRELQVEEAKRIMEEESEKYWDDYGVAWSIVAFILFYLLFRGS